MYEFLFPEEVDLEEVEEIYPDPELNKVMQARKRDKSDVIKFEQKCKQQNKEVPEITPKWIPTKEQIQKMNTRSAMSDPSDPSRTAGSTVPGNEVVGSAG